MKILNSIKSYTYYDQDDKIDQALVKERFIAPNPIGWVSKQLISFSIGQNEVTLDLTGNFDTENFILNNTDFDEDMLALFAKIFDLELFKDPISGYVSLGIKKHQTLKVIIKEINDITVAIVFDYTDGGGRQPASIYVHGIWQVMLDH